MPLSHIWCCLNSLKAFKNIDTHFYYSEKILNFTIINDFITKMSKEIYCTTLRCTSYVNWKWTFSRFSVCVFKRHRKMWGEKNQKNQVREENDFSQHFPLTFFFSLASNTRISKWGKKKKIVWNNNSIDQHYRFSFSTFIMQQLSYLSKANIQKIVERKLRICYQK